MKKLFRISTVPISLNILLKGQLAYLNRFYALTAISGAGKDLEEVKDREEVATYAIEISRQINIVNDLHALYQLYSYFKREKPDMIHSITPKAGLLSMVAGKLAGVPLRMHTFTGLIFPSRTGLMQKILIQMDRLLCACATHIFPEGQGVKRDLETYKITAKPLKVIANGNVNGIDTAHFNSDLFSTDDTRRLRTDLGLTETDFVFIFVGRLVGDKGINELVTAFSKLQAEPVTERSTSAAPLKLLLVGPLETDLDPLRPETLQEIAQNPHIISLGYREDVRPCFAVADALAFPSYREGFPNVVLQAGAMGLPAIVTDINGCNEIIHHEQNGLIIPPKNAPALADALRRIATDTELYTHLQKNSRPRIQQNYEQTVVWEALLAEYRNAESHV